MASADFGNSAIIWELWARVSNCACVSVYKKGQKAGPQLNLKVSGLPIHRCKDNWPLPVSEE